MSPATDAQLAILVRLREHLAGGDLGAAASALAEARRLGASDEILGGLVYEHVIQPEEAFYARSFSDAVSLLATHSLLFVEPAPAFEAARASTAYLPDPLGAPGAPIIGKGEQPVVLVDVADLSILSQALDARPLVYLVFDDTSRLNAFLLFYNLDDLSQFITSYRLLVFGGPSGATLR